MPTEAQAELAKLRDILSRPTTPKEWPKVVAKVNRRIDAVIELLNKAPVNAGRLGGQTTAERMKAKDPEYYKKIAAMRKTKGGGRPKNQTS